MSAHKPLNQQVIVVTGASSGIGLATARMSAGRGARVVLAARNGEALDAVRAEIERGGGVAEPVVADVSDRAQVQAVADRAIQRFGRIDTWVNNAGLSIFGRLEEVDDADSRRLFDTNFWGVVQGSLVALPHLKQSGGVLINLGSVASDIAFPLQGMYCATKHAIKGFTDALRMELEEEGAPVSVTLIKPAAIDTPFAENARNYTDRQPKLPPPVYRTEEVAEAIVHAATHPQRDIYVGGGGRLMSAAQSIAPRTFDRIGRTMVGQQLRDEPARERDGTLYRAGHGGRTSGDHPGYVMRRSLYTRSVLHPVTAAAVVAGLGLAATGLMGGRRRR
ncbi:SDR family oxidoreductase [Methylobacterium oxalidis]|uniref:Short-chain dehydrogenase n=1 Tax=Methylobacterium oxalidis TaxID=944322 RepID=A0A512J8X3_9HYPH|nr:SDR family oxidoreductase [Methylobacterium oxalidis]GEP06365.1 short-chain dehydrogenase [Methylobacterium oxalidis]GJE29884.1 3-phenylpropionate-dihydrodiol/cinnamic acid-dihydrodiol dehydrogenase [Methylobacterium oxalidis]GLS62442.1 short-chain dehydrogenase [Methylobacterium oxalidis]